MQYRYENIKNDPKIPVKIFTHTLEEFPYHWHEEVEILFVLKGKVEVFIDKEKSIIDEGDLFLINTNEIHYVKSIDYLQASQLLVLQFNIEALKGYDVDISNLEFKLNSSEKDTGLEPYYSKIRHVLAVLMNIEINEEEPRELLLKRQFLDLIITLVNKFKVKDLNKAGTKKVSDDRLIEIIKYINNNYEDSTLSVNDIAEKFYLNHQYVSRFFKENTGVSVKTYTENLRLNKSLKALKLTKDRIIDIAMAHGFPDEKAYYRVFKKVLDITPNQYREINSIETTKEREINYFNLNSSESLNSLFKYLVIETPKNTEVQRETLEKTINAKAIVGRVEKSWKSLITFGHASHGIRSDFKSQLKRLQKDLSFEYVRFHGVLSDELLIYNVRSNGEFYYNFNHLDTLIDNLLEVKLKPFLEIGFMPKELARNTNSLFTWSSYMSPPTDIYKWRALIEAFIKHLINRYGIEEVRQWYFEIWNEPNIEGVFWKGTQEEFFDFYKHTYEVIKGIDKELAVGGFGNLNVGDLEGWLKSFQQYSIKNNCPLDFYSFHAYQFAASIDNNDMEELIKVGLNNQNLMVVENFKNLDIFKTGDENYISKAIDDMLALSKNLTLRREELWITEWNSTVDSRDLVHDTCYMAAYIVKTSLANRDKVKGLGYWTFTDLFEEFKEKQTLFHGGFGLLTYNGIKKPSYHAFEFLNKLGDEVVYEEEGLIVTKRGEDYKILLYNYSHYNDLYCSFDYSQMSQTNRYEVFKASVEKYYSINMEELKGEYLIEKYRVNRDNGSSFDAWVRMGAPEQLTKDGYKYLEKTSEWNYQTSLEVVENLLVLKTDLLPHEIQFINITKQY